MSSQRIEGTFDVQSFEPVEAVVAEPVNAAMPVGVAILTKRYSGAVEGRSVTWFTGCHDVLTGAGSYVAFESFEGTLGGLTGAFSFTHVASTHGTDRYAESFAIVEGSGTGDLAGLSGGGGLAVDDDGTHRVWFDVISP